MLACTRLGAPHTVVFGGFSADSLSEPHERHGLRGADHAGRGVAARHDGAAEEDRRRGDGATRRASSAAVVLRRTGNDVPMQDGRDHWWHELDDGVSDDPASCPCEPMDAEDLLFLMYTSGTTAKPKGIVAHDRRLPRRRRRRRTTTSSTSSPRPTSTGARPTSAGSPGTATSSTGRSATARRRVHLRGDAGLPGQGPLVGDRRALRRRRSSTRRRPRSART